MGAYVCFDRHIHIGYETRTNGILSQLGYVDINEQMLNEIVSNKRLKWIQISECLPDEAYQKIDQILLVRPDITFRLFQGKMRGLPLNRAVYVQDNDKKEVVDIICGKFFICYAPPESESFQSLPDDMMKKYKEQFKYPERFSKEVGGNIVAEPFKPKSKDYER